MRELHTCCFRGIHINDPTVVSFASLLSKAQFFKQLKNIKQGIGNQVGGVEKSTLKQDMRKEDRCNQLALL